MQHTRRWQGAATPSAGWAWLIVDVHLYLQTNNIYNKYSGQMVELSANPRYLIMIRLLEWAREAGLIRAQEAIKMHLKGSESHAHYITTILPAHCSSTNFTNQMKARAALSTNFSSTLMSTLLYNPSGSLFLLPLNRRWTSWCDSLTSQHQCQSHGQQLWGYWDLHPHGSLLLSLPKSWPTTSLIQPALQPWQNQLQLFIIASSAYFT